MSEYVNEAVKRELKSWTKKIGRTQAELLKEYTEKFVPMAKQEDPNRTVSQIRRRALRLQKNHYMRIYGTIKRSRAVLFRGFIEGEFVQDRVEVLKRIAESYKADEEKRAAAIEAGILSEDGIPLDTRVTVRGRANPNFGKPLANAPPQIVRNFYGFVKDENDQWREFRMTAWEEIAEKLSCVHLSPVEFRAIQKLDTEPLLLNASRLTKFIEIKDDPKWNYEEIIREHGRFKTLADLPEILSRKGERIFRFEVTVLNLNLETAGPNKIAYVADDTIGFPDEQVTVFIPPTVPIEFGDDSDIYLLGRVGRDRRGQPTISAIGILPLAGRTTYKGTKRFEIEDLTPELI